jgi:hypothetical protein
MCSYGIYNPGRLLQTTKLVIPKLFCSSKSLNSNKYQPAFSSGNIHIRKGNERK